MPLVRDRLQARELWWFPTLPGKRSDSVQNALGATYCRDLSNYGERTLLLNPSDPNCYKFLSDNSIIAYNADNELIVLSSKRSEECNLRQEFLKDIRAWYVLRPKESNDWQVSSHAHLPLSLRGWYEYILPTDNSTNSKFANPKRVLQQAKVAEN